MHPYTNRLIHESSPYLLQHAHNPVDWYPWGDEAFERAKKEDKPVLVSIGYAACHWCHVMERESFEDAETANLMNEHFVNIKVDREERPDVDHIYMDAVQAITGSGGWPLNVFLTPDRKPFYGGTYFPPRRAFNRASWKEVLLSISSSYQNKKDEIEQQAELLTEHLKTSNSFNILSQQQDFSAENIDIAFNNAMKTADKEWGGFGRAPKFPQTFTINFLLAYSYISKNDEAMRQALLSIDKMIHGGIYDHIGGGFARYSTDTEWLVPHFEKMLYDNALLVSTICDAYQLTKNNFYKETIEQTLEFVERELMNEEGGFYSALDADSEGEEGKFYVWKYDEVKEVLGVEAEIFCNFFDITLRGNWHEPNHAEGRNIPRIKIPLKEFSEAENFDSEELKNLIQEGKKKLLRKRSERVRPALDDKVLLSWNALMNIAYSKAYAATCNEHYKKVAEKNINFLLRSFGEDISSLNHSWKNGVSRHPAFLDDYSHLISALISLAQVTTDYSYLTRAAELVEIVLQDFSDDESRFFYYTRKGQHDILLRKKEIYDGATPSGNAVIAYNLYQLSILLDKPEWRARAEVMVLSISEVATKYPTSFGVWLSILYEITSGTAELVIMGSKAKSLLNEVLFLYLPHKLLMSSEKPENGFPLLAGKWPENGENHIYLCKNYSCQKPVFTVAELVELLNLK